MNKQTTIRMPQNLLTKWLQALRSGKYEQGKGALKSASGYCCLGVLQMATDGQVETDPYGKGDTPLGLPTKAWLDKNRVEFYGENRNITSTSPLLPMFGYGATWANDHQGKSFDQIADAIEDCAEGF